MYEVTSLPKRINIGFKGEKKFRSIEVDMSKWHIPNGVPAIVYQKPNGTPYKPTVTFSNNILKWEIDGTDVNVDGMGYMQVEMKSDTVAAKSSIVELTIHYAITR